jgi:hypothetical protein
MGKQKLILSSQIPANHPNKKGKKSKKGGRPRTNHRLFLRASGPRGVSVVPTRGTTFTRERALAPGFWPPSTHGWSTLPSLTDGVCLFLTPQLANEKRWISKRRATVPPHGARSFFQLCMHRPTIVPSCGTRSFFSDSLYPS